jgi:hypothetical protein
MTGRPVSARVLWSRVRSARWAAANAGPSVFNGNDLDYAKFLQLLAAAAAVAERHTRNDFGATVDADRINRATP